jgi:hypothetical protein
LRAGKPAQVLAAKNPTPAAINPTIAQHNSKGSSTTTTALPMVNACTLENPMQ